MKNSKKKHKHNFNILMGLKKRGKDLWMCDCGKVRLCKNGVFEELKGVLFGRIK